jgi:Zn-dependent protease
LPLVDFGQLPISFTVLLVSLTLHEAAHAWAGELFGDPTPSQQGRLSFSPLAHLSLPGSLLFPLASFAGGYALIGWTKPAPVDVRELGSRWRARVLMIAAAGPLASLVVAAVAAGAIRLGVTATGSPLDAITAPLLFRAVDLNVLLAVFNLLPVPPLDAGNALAMLLPSAFVPAAAPWRVAGVLLLFVLALSGILAIVIRPLRSPIVDLLL